jgi:DUF3043 family protein
MPVLRRKTSPPPAEPEPTPVKPGGKGRATPSRKEAEAARKGRPASQSGDSKEARRAAREERRVQAQGYREAMMAGDVSRLPPRERAPERVLARQIVDERRNVGPIFLSLLVLNFAASVIPSLILKLVCTYLLVFGLALFALDGYVLSRNVAAARDERFRNSSVPVKVYSIQRSLLPGRFRMPRPRGQVNGWLPAGFRSIFSRR